MIIPTKHDVGSLHYDVGDVYYDAGSLHYDAGSIWLNIVKRMVIGKSSPFTGLEWPRGFQEVQIPRFHDNGIG